MLNKLFCEKMPKYLTYIIFISTFPPFDSRHVVTASKQHAYINILKGLVSLSLVVIEELKLLLVSRQI